MTAFNILSVVGVIAVAVNVWAYVDLTAQLETKHRPVWERLGQPGFYNDYRNFFQPTLRFWGYVYSGGFWRTSDSRVRLLGTAFLASNVVLLVLLLLYFTQ